MDAPRGKFSIMDVRRVGYRGAGALAALTGALALSACALPIQSTTNTTIHTPGSPTTIPATVAPNSARVLLNQFGSGPATSKSFAVTKTPWVLSWGISCTPKRGGGSVRVREKTTRGYRTIGVSAIRLGVYMELSPKYSQAGTFVIGISTNCGWSVFVTQPAA